MRLKNLIICLLFCIASMSAKDIITKTDGTQIDAKVEEITETLIKYRKASNPTGPIYSVAINSVANIIYENGEVEKFNESSSTVAPVQNTSNSLSDDDLIRMSGEQETVNTPTGISDNQLLKMFNNEKQIPLKVQEQVSHYRKIGWIGGSLFLVAGISTGIALYFNDRFYDTCGLWMAAGGIAGGAWWLYYNRKANLLIKQARALQSYSATIIENEILRLGDKSLTAGINLMDNRMVHTHALGLSIGLNF